MTTKAVEQFDAGDLVAMAQCMAIDADAFPYASAHFGLKAASARVWVVRAEIATRVVGFLAARVRRGAMHVEGLAVEQGERRRGFGRALVRVAAAHGRTVGLRAIGLHVSVSNHGAIALYRAEGFTSGVRLQNFYPAAAFGGERDALEMKLLLPE
jgi:ribosomal protein S18 acetylase RimI-like enzyme